MAVHTILLDFTVDMTQVHNDTHLSVISTNIENILRDYLTNLKEISHLILDEGLLKLYSCDYGAIVNLRIYSNGLITVNIEYLKAEEKEPLLSFERVKTIEQDVSERVQGILKSRAIVPIKRGIFPSYYSTSDDRLIEYDLDELVFEEKTPYQKVQIVHSKSLGNMLVLDDLQNISEGDLVYTETLMAKGKESYRGKEIVILGGGDGALLFELLKEDPKEVIMLEIDDVVVRECAKHMRSICGDVLDKRKGPNYQIIIGDCMPALDAYIKEGRKFDYVFGDLTDVPISNDSELWDFIDKVFQKAFKVLKPDGKYMTHLYGSNCGDAMKMYEAKLGKLQPPVKLSKTKTFVPCFMEDWFFGYISFVKKQ